MDKKSAQQFYWIMIILLLQAFVLLFLGSLNFLKISSLVVRKFIGFAIYFYPILGVSLSFATFFLIRRIFELFKVESEVGKYCLQIEKDSEFIKRLRAQRHDYLNHFQIIFTLVQMGKHNEIIPYIETISSGMDDSEKKLELSKLEKKGILYSMLTAQMVRAQSNNISMNLEFQSLLKEIEMPEYELNRIIENLLNNAMEEVEKLPEDKRSIKLSIYENASSYVFNVVNSCHTINPDQLNSFFIPHFSTKKGANRGMGLYVVKELVEKFRGRIEIKMLDKNEISIGFTLPRDGKGNESILRVESA